MQNGENDLTRRRPRQLTIVDVASMSATATTRPSPNLNFVFYFNRSFLSEPAAWGKLKWIFDRNIDEVTDVQAEEWSMRNWTGGCVRRTQLKCQRLNNGSSVGENIKDDGFLRLQMMKAPDFPENCSCLAYAYDIGIGCMTWSQELIDLQRFSDKMRDYKATIISVSVLGTVFIVPALYVALRWNIRRRKGRKRVSAEVLLLSDIGYAATVHSDHAELHEMPLFSFTLLATATGDFDAAKKLGQGGFGPVYKGTLADGKQIAVKRLSASSGQGLAEFMNEHRNLVRLLGCCVERGEKMLVYEYMPNKSLDSYIFDPLEREKLEWRKRCEIIEGIGRGLLNLHRDSRMRIIHRDLKPGNILLDDELNPKISDFGLARILHSNQDQARTIRVVAHISGRRNTSFYQDDRSLTLLGFAWNMWNEERIESLIDPALSNANVGLEILRCIHIGLLCVQELAGDRPCMSPVLSMLNTEILDLPHPMHTQSCHKLYHIRPVIFFQIWFFRFIVYHCLSFLFFILIFSRFRTAKIPIIFAVRNCEKLHVIFAVKKSLFFNNENNMNFHSSELRKGQNEKQTKRSFKNDRE
uniref:Protein kinase domain-containing protein n=1 Tax=Kalanchoe fedtschenkoi TaxID=63787 RepID=A0A7N0UZY7_KALFE